MRLALNNRRWANLTWATCTQKRVQLHALALLPEFPSSAMGMASPEWCPPPPSECRRRIHRERQSWPEEPVSKRECQLEPAAEMWGVYQGRYFAKSIQLDSEQVTVLSNNRTYTGQTLMLNDFMGFTQLTPDWENLPEKNSSFFEEEKRRGRNKKEIEWKET